MAGTGRDGTGRDGAAWHGTARHGSGPSTGKGTAQQGTARGTARGGMGHGMARGGTTQHGLLVVLSFKYGCSHGLAISPLPGTAPSDVNWLASREPHR